MTSVAENKKRGEGGELDGEGEKRGGRVGGGKLRGGGLDWLKPMCERDGGSVGGAVRKFYWAEKFSYCPDNPLPHHSHT